MLVARVSSYSEFCVQLYCREFLQATLRGVCQNTLYGYVYARHTHHAPRSTRRAATQQEKYLENYLESYLENYQLWTYGGFP